MTTLFCPPMSAYSTENPLAIDLIAVSGPTTPYVALYSFESGAFGTKKANPSVLRGQINSLAFSRAGDAIAFGTSGVSLELQVWKISSSGFGTGYQPSSGTSPNENSNGVVFTKHGDHVIATEGSLNDRCLSYPWDHASLGQSDHSPSAVSQLGSHGVAITPAGDYVAITHLSDPYFSVWPWSESGFGTRCTSPASLPTGSSYGVAFSPQGDYIAVSHATAPYLSVYPFSGGVIGAKIANPLTLPTGTCFSVQFMPETGNFLAVSMSVAPYIHVYSFSGGSIGSKIANPATLPTGAGNCVAFKPSRDFIALAHDAAPYLSVWPWSVSGFGAKIADPASLPSGNGSSVAWTTT